MNVTKKRKFLFFVSMIHLAKTFHTPKTTIQNLNKHKFRHGFGDAVGLMCGCNAEIENTKHLFLHCHF